MSEEMQSHYYMNIPAFVWDDKDLLRKPKAILLYGHISTLANKKGYCWATNEYFGKRLGISKQSVVNYINLLVCKGYIKRTIKYKKETKQVEKRFLSICTTPGITDCTTPSINDDTTPGITDCTDNNTSTNKLGFYVINFYENNVGMISPWIREDIEYEVQEWYKINTNEAEKIIVEALKNAIGSQARNKWKYAKSILSSWKERNIKSLSDIKADDKQHQREVQTRYSHKSYGRKPIEEKIPDWNMQTPKPQTQKNAADIKKLMAKVNQKTAANKDGVKSKEE